MPLVKKQALWNNKKVDMIEFCWKQENPVTPNTKFELDINIRYCASSITWMNKFKLKSLLKKEKKTKTEELASYQQTLPDQAC